MKLTAKEILEIIANDEEHEAFGLRADRAGIEIGETLANSHQWYQDWQEWWGDFPEDDYNADPEHPYNAEMGCWDDGELDGVCTIGISTEMSEAEIEQAMKAISVYLDGLHTEIYLVVGDMGQGGNDIGEIIISDHERIA